MLQAIVSLLSGIAGGNIAGAVLKKFSLGIVWNSILGLLGGGLGGELRCMISGGGTLQTGSILGCILSSALGGGVLMSIVGLLKTRMAK
jgi:hypothetical protein